MGAIFGQCPRCPKNSPAKRLYGGVCSFHFANVKDDQSREKIVKDFKIIADAKLLNKWFADQLLIAPGKCENCGDKIVIPSGLSKKTKVCHIVPKKNFDSVKTHPLNRWFGCYQCHQDYDSSWSRAINMPIWPVCVERFRTFMALIKPSEVKHLPAPLHAILHSVG